MFEIKRECWGQSWENGGRLVRTEVLILICSHWKRRKNRAGLVAHVTVTAFSY